jgi:hypothetical protein
MPIFLTVLGSAALLYLIEVVLGSSSSVHDCELGQTSSLDARSRVSRREFFGNILPLLLAALGLPLLFTLPFLALAFLLVALVLAAGRGLRPPDPVP